MMRIYLDSHNVEVKQKLRNMRNFIDKDSKKDLFFLEMKKWKRKSKTIKKKILKYDCKTILWEQSISKTFVVRQLINYNEYIFPSS